ncbi:MAG: RNA polymerase sigma factor, partial [Candidatus Zixiibacteriota bacterium]
TTAFRPWFYRILVNTFKSTVRRPWWKRRVPLTPEITQTLTVNSPATASDARRWLEQAFKAISPRDQALVVLYELEEWTISELSELLGISTGAVKSRLFRSRQKMKKALSRLTPAIENRSSTAINLAEEKP